MRGAILRADPSLSLHCLLLVVETVVSCPLKGPMHLSLQTEEFAISLMVFFLHILTWCYVGEIEDKFSRSQSLSPTSAYCLSPPASASSIYKICPRSVGSSSFLLLPTQPPKLHHPPPGLQQKPSSWSSLFHSSCLQLETRVIFFIE